MDPRARVARVLKSISMITHLLHPVMLHTWFWNNFAHTIRTTWNTENLEHYLAHNKHMIKSELSSYTLAPARLAVLMFQ